MKIAQVIDSLRIGGAEKMTVLLCNLLVRNGHEITLISITDEVPLLNELDTRVKVILLNRRFKFSVAKMFRMNRLLSGFDIIHVHLFYNLKYLWVCGAFLKMRSKVVYHDHNGDIHLHREYSALQKYLFSKCDVICVSAEISEWAVHTLHLPQSRVFTLPNTIQRQPAPLMKYAPQPGLLRLVLVSNVRTTKNIEFALDLVAALKRTIKLKLDIYGNVNDPEYFSFLESKMTSLGVGGEVNFISGVNSISTRDMPLYRQPNWARWY